MAFDVNNPYFRTKVLTASPEQLRLLLIEGCIRFLRDGSAALERKDFEALYKSLTDARAILVELTTSLRREVDPELTARLESIYTYVLRLTVDGSFNKDPGKLAEAIALMEYDRETWMMLMEKVAQDRSAPAEAMASGPGPSRPALSVQG